MRRLGWGEGGSWSYSFARTLDLTLTLDRDGGSKSRSKRTCGLSEEGEGDGGGEGDDLGGWTHAQSPFQSSEEFAKYAMKLREAALTAIEPRVSIPTTARTMGGAYRWKNNIVTTIFWCGENAAQNNPVHNRSSSWDLYWSQSFGGYDNPDPAARTRDYRPIAFIPKQNPFYFALPYNDVTRGTTKPESRQVIPWFRQAFVQEGQSVCRDRWIAIRNSRNGRIAYAQWGDCGPFRPGHWEYG